MSATQPAPNTVGPHSRNPVAFSRVVKSRSVQLATAALTRAIGQFAEVKEVTQKAKKGEYNSLEEYQNSLERQLTSINDGVSSRQLYSESSRQLYSEETAKLTAQLFSNAVTSPTSLLTQEVKDLNQMLKESGISTDDSAAFKAHFDKLLAPPEKGKTSRQQKEVQALREVLGKYYRVKDAYDVLTKTGAVSKAKKDSLRILQKLVITALPKSVKKEFFDEQIPKVKMALHQAGFSYESFHPMPILFPFHTVIDNPRNSKEINRMVAFACLHVEAHEYHPKEVVAFVHSLVPENPGKFKDALNLSRVISQAPGSTGPRLVTVPKDYQLNKEEKAQLKMLYSQFKKSHDKSECAALKQHIKALVYQHELPFQACKRAIQFWDHLTVGQKHTSPLSTQPLSAQDADIKMGQRHCYAALSKTTQGRVTVIQRPDTVARYFGASKPTTPTEDLKTYVKQLVEYSIYQRIVNNKVDSKLSEISRQTQTTDTYKRLEVSKHVLIQETQAQAKRNGLAQSFAAESKAEAEGSHHVTELSEKILALMGTNPAAAVRFMHQLERDCDFHQDPKRFEDSPLFHEINATCHYSSFSDFASQLSGEHPTELYLTCALVSIQQMRQAGKSSALLEFRRPGFELSATSVQGRLLSKEGISRELKFALKQDGRLNSKQQKAILDVFSYLHNQGKGSSYSQAKEFALSLLEELAKKDPSEDFAKKLVVWAKSQKYDVQMPRIMNKLRVGTVSEPKFEFSQTERQAIQDKLVSATTRKEQKQFVKELKAQLVLVKRAPVEYKSVIKAEILLWAGAPYEKTLADGPEGSDYDNVSLDEGADPSFAFNPSYEDRDDASLLDEHPGDPAEYTLASPDPDPDPDDEGTPLLQPAPKLSPRGVHFSQDVIKRDEKKEQDEEAKKKLHAEKQQTRRPALGAGILPENLAQSMKRRGMIGDGGGNDLRAGLRHTGRNLLS